MSELALTVNGVSVSYRRGDPVLHNTNLEVAAGSWVAVIGPNGAGKSTLLKAVAGLVAHTGTVGFGDRAAGTAPNRARQVAYVAQQPVLPPGMTVAEYVLLGRTAHLGWLAVEGEGDRQVVTDVLDRLALNDLAHHPITELSGGEVQRAVLARALAQQTPVLVLDEPTSALDIGHQITVLELVDQLRSEQCLTVVSAMHDLSLAGRFADEVVLIDAGQVVAAGPPDQVLTEPVLSRYYQTPVQVLAGADGGAVVVPLRQPAHQRNETLP